MLKKDVWAIWKVGPPGFEPESMAPEATRIPSYPTGPRI